MFLAMQPIADKSSFDQALSYSISFCNQQILPLLIVQSNCQVRLSKFAGFTPYFGIASRTRQE
jgi:hypothetical protein